MAGVPGDPNTFYFATPGGGVWKTTDGGQVWRPIFDSVRVASIGSLAVAPSDPRVVYVGTGEQTRGNGIYRSNDAGATWQHVGLDDLLFIQSIVIDPIDPNVVVVAGNTVGVGLLWHPLPHWVNTANKGIFKTTDGGKTWRKVYAAGDSLGVVDMCWDLSNPRLMFAVTFHPESGEGDKHVDATSDIFRSTDGGATWSALESKGLPDKDRGRVGVIVAPATGGKRVYAIVKQGFYRSDDGGATWEQSTKDPRVIGSEYFSRVFVDPNYPDVIYVAETSMYRSTDGGKTFEAFTGAPSGDDFHVAWVDPKDSAHLIFGVDQGAIVSLDSGKTWSSWYNQPTGQFYHVSTDNVFPYRVYGAQQDSGTAGVLSRSDYGEILQQDWYSVAGFEYAFITPDPAHPNWIYSNGWYGSVIRLDTNTGQFATLFEKGQKYRTAQMPPLIFAPHDPSVLYLGTQFVLKTTDQGVTWHEISPDLTDYVEKEEEEGKAAPGRPRPPALTAIAPSPLDSAEIWAGTTNRLVYLTRDGGKNWNKVTPDGLAEPTQVLYVEASHHDPATAYLTVGATRESTPAWVARTHDYGKTWQKVVTGLPENEMARVVREDPKRKGLLYAGTDTSVFVSWDDGDHWQPLSLNLPPTPITDLEVHGNDLVISTFGRSLWILDDVTPLREMSAQVASANLHLFTPGNAMRVRWENYQDTPYPAETPAGQNPPDGVILDYFLKDAPAGDLTLTIYDEKGTQVASFSSRPQPEALPPANVPEYWFAPPTALTKKPGVNRFAWDLRYPPPATLPYGYYGELLEYTEYTLADHAVPGETPRQQPRGPLVVPGKYTAELRSGGGSVKQTFTVTLDPRIHATNADLAAQADVAHQITRGMRSTHDNYEQVAALHKVLTERQKSLTDNAAQDSAKQLEKKIEALEKGPKKTPGFGPLNRDLGRLIFSVESADIRPTDSVRSAVEQACAQLDKDIAAWQQLNANEVAAFNAKVKGTALPVATVEPKGCR